MHRSEKLIAATGRAAVMTDLQYVGVQVVPIVSEEPIFFAPLRISDKQKTHHSITHQSDCAGEVRILETDGPRRVRREKRERDAVDHKGITGMDAVPLHAFLLRRRQRRDVALGPSRERSVPIVPRVQRSDDACRASDVVTVWMRKYERAQRSAAA